MKLDLKLLGYVNVFETKTRTSVKDCFFDQKECLVFIVNPGFGYKAIGKGGVVVKKLNFLFKKRIKVIEFSNDPVVFVKNILYPLKPCDVLLRDNNLVIKAEGTYNKALLIGRDKRNLNNLKSIFSKFYEYSIVIE